MTGHCHNSSIKATVGAGVSCALYMPCALGPRHTVIITVKSPSQDRARSMIIKLEALALSAVSTSERQFHNKNKE